MLNLYDDALVRFFQQLRWQGSIIPIVVAGADRAHAQVKEWLKENKDLKISQACGETALPYPFIAVNLEPFIRDPELTNPGLHRNFAMQTEAGYGFAVRNPRAVKAPMEINFYFSSQEQSRHVEFQYYTLFPLDQAWVDVDYADPKWYLPPNEVFEFAKILGQRQLRLTVQGLVDNSSLEDSGLNQRELRFTLSGELYGWIPFQPYAVPIAQSLEYQLFEKDSEEEIVTVTIPLS